MMLETLVTHRNNQNQVAIIFVHGFGGNPHKTWGQFPTFLSQDQRIHNWDIYSLGFPSGLGFDLIDIWKAHPSIETIARNLITYSQTQLRRYKSLAFVAHSMGGLVVQRALVDDPDFVKRVGHLFFFGTPSNGLKKAVFFQFWKRQIDNMAEGGPFISDLRTRWKDTFTKEVTPFQYCITAGDQDEFVPINSSQSGFPENRCFVVTGDHLSIVKPASKENLSVQLVLNGLIGQANAITIADAAQRAIQDRQFHKTITLLEPNKDKLDKRSIVALALAYEGIGRQADALTMLQTHYADDTDAMGVLAGRLKRRWLIERQAHDAEAAQALYQKGFDRSLEKNNCAQAYYHGINLAFMALAYDDNLHVAQDFARQALEQCAQDQKNKWRHATEGEAHLILGDTHAAIHHYQAALVAKPAPNPREVDSMLQQAIKVASLLGNVETADQLMAIFGRDPS